MTQYKMFSDEAVEKFRSFAVAAGLNQRHPQGAFDAKPKFARDQDVPVEALTKLVSGLLTENASLKRGMANDAAPLPPNADDIIEALTELHGLASEGMQPDRFEQTHALVARISERVRQLQKAVNQLTNAETLANGGDEPPDFPGKPKRGGGAMDGFNERYPSAARLTPRDDWQASRKRMLTAASRIGQV